MKKATTVSASQVYGEKAIQVKWDKIVGAQKYYIYRATSENGMYRNIGVCTEPNIIDDQVNIGTKYYYYIEAAYVDDDRVTTNKSSATVVSSKDKIIRSKRLKLKENIRHGRFIGELYQMKVTVLNVYEKSKWKIQKNQYYY